MLSFDCIIQEGVIPDDLRPELASELARIITSIVGGDPAEVGVEFTVIPKGFGFRGGELSTTSIVRGQVPPGCDQEVRVRVMQEILDMWKAKTGCATDELIVSARDYQETPVA